MFYQQSDNNCPNSANTASTTSTDSLTPVLAVSPDPTTSNGFSTFYSTDTLKAEVLRALQMVIRHHSYSPMMTFTPSLGRCSLTCSVPKHLLVEGTKPIILQDLDSLHTLKESLAQGSFVVMFDESMNRTTKSKQLDMHVRYWVNDENGS